VVPVYYAAREIREIFTGLRDAEWSEGCVFLSPPATGRAAAHRAQSGACAAAEIRRPSR